MALTTEFAFTLPRGYLAPDGSIHQRGVMRLATARDEIEPLRDPRVQSVDDPYLTVIVLSRVITELGTLNSVTPREIENLFAADLAYLQDLYGVVNFGTADDVYVFLRETNSNAELYDDENEDDSATVSGNKSKTASKVKPTQKISTDEDAELEDEAVITTGRRRGGAVIEEVKD
jgi:hypothetical protein